MGSKLLQLDLYLSSGMARPVRRQVTWKLVVERGSRSRRGWGGGWDGAGQGGRKKAESREGL